MRKGRDVTGLPVLTFDTGEKIGEVKDLLLDQEHNRVLGLLLSEGSMFQEPRAVPFADVKSIGPDGVIIPSASVTTSVKSSEKLSEAVEAGRIVNGAKVFTESGRNLGEIHDIVFDEATGTIESYEVSGGFFADRFKGKPIMPAPETIRIGKHVVYVPDSTAEKMEQQVGGVAGAFRTTGESAREGTTGAVERLRGKGGELGERLAAMSKEQQKRFVVGKASPIDVLDSQGQPIVARGQIVTEEMAERAYQDGKLGELVGAIGRGHVVSVGGSLREQMSSLYETVSARVGEAITQFQERQLETIKGRPANRDVIADDGAVIVTQGQPVTQEAVDAAEKYGKVTELLAAAGMGRVQELIEGARRRTLDIFGQTSREVEKEEESQAPQAPEPPASEASSQGQTEAGRQTSIQGLEQPERSQPGVSSTSERREGMGASAAAQEQPTSPNQAEAAERARVEAILGKPVDHAILDDHGNVILEPGQTVTLEAVERAQRAGKLDDLRAAVYPVTPQEGEGRFIR